MCLYPTLRINRKYTATKKNKGIIPECKDERVKYVATGCGKCMECMKQKKRNWQIRLLEEIKINTESLFITLTFSEEHLSRIEEMLKNEISETKILENEIATKAVRLFLESIRKETKKSVKHWFITELGHQNTERIHIHGIIFTKDKELIKRHWKNGFIYFGKYVNQKTVNYIVKYVNKLDLKHKGYTGKVLCSKGIGSNYLNKYDSNLNKYNGKETKEYYRTTDGTKIALPIYYRNKIYNEEEREKLWINKLDEEIRYVGGEKVSIKVNDKEYNELLQFYQEKNKRLGYGDNSEEWSVTEYKKKRNELKRLKYLENNKINSTFENQNIKNENLKINFYGND